MRILRTDPRLLEKEYGILCQRLFPDHNVQPPFGTTWCVVEPGKTTTPHAHSEGESFLIWKGTGLITWEKVSRVVTAGDWIYLPSGGRHELANTGSEDLEFVSLYWEPASPRFPGGGKAIALHAAPPTPNGPLHLGHLSGPYLAGDVLRRQLHRFGREARYLAGTDDYQSYVAAKAAERSGSVSETLDTFGGQIRGGFQAAGISFHGFLEPAKNAEHNEFVRSYFTRLVNQGKLERRRTEALHCGRCDLYLYEVHVAGLCPHCGEGTLGNGCEACGLPNQPEELTDPVCRACGGKAGRKAFDRWFLPLSRYQKRLETFWASVGKTPRIAAYLERLRKVGLKDIPVTHYDRWGIAVPDSSGGEVIHAWFEMAASFLFSEKQAGLVEPDRILLFGFDNAFYYSSLVPALWLGANPQANLPIRFVTNEFLNLEGAKFSTSRRHAVWALEAVPSLPRDLVRSFLLSVRPEHEATNFTFEGLQAHAAFLDRNLFAWLSRLDEIVRKDFDGVVPEAGVLDPTSLSSFAGLASLSRDFEARLSPECFDLAAAARVLARFLEEVRAFASSQEPLRSVESERARLARGVYLQLAAVRWLAHAADGFFPDLAARLRAGLGDAAPRAWTLSDGPGAGSAVGQLSESGPSLESLVREWLPERFQPQARSASHVQPV